MTNQSLAKFLREHTNSLIDDMNYRSFNSGHVSTIVLECPGLSTEDICLSIEQSNALAYLLVKGNRIEKELENREFSIEFKAALGERTIEKIEYTVKNGILYIIIEYKSNEIEGIRIIKK